ncbi:MAG: addiction module protein [Gemmatimonadetes bacterium]|nr:addiction module protein [Gemmatimonadota bacterium]
MSGPIAVDDLTAEERIELIGRLWDSLDPAVAAPITPALAAELHRREAEADEAPEAGDDWADIRDELRKKLR